MPKGVEGNFLKRKCRLFLVKIVPVNTELDILYSGVGSEEVCIVGDEASVILPD